MGKVEIPQAAYGACLKAQHDVDAGDAGYAYARGLEAAAPIIARAAQVAILREMADKLVNRKRAQDGGWNNLTGFEPWAVLYAKADELERGE